jgi:hypothetical protein
MMYQLGRVIGAANRSIVSIIARLSESMAGNDINDHRCRRIPRRIVPDADERREPTACRCGRSPKSRQRQ